jgi:hypothetical protein
MPVTAERRSSRVPKKIERYRARPAKRGERPQRPQFPAQQKLQIELAYYKTPYMGRDFFICGRCKSVMLRLTFVMDQQREFLVCCDRCMAPEDRGVFRGFMGPKAL